MRALILPDRARGENKAIPVAVIASHSMTLHVLQIATFASLGVLVFFLYCLLGRVATSGQIISVMDMLLGKSGRKRRNNRVENTIGFCKLQKPAFHRSSYYVYPIISIHTGGKDRSCNTPDSPDRE